jgi:hypothetical protein
LALDRFVDAQGAAAKIAAIQSLDGRIAGLAAVERHEGEAAGPASGTIQGQVKIHHRAVGFK